MKRFNKSARLLALVSLIVCALPTSSFAGQSEARMVRGLSRTILSVFEIPKSIVDHSTKTVFPVGIISGTVAGAVRTVTGVVTGVVETAVGALPYAKYAAVLA